MAEKTPDWYAVLGCTPESSKAAIEKAARKLFLKYHPDKTTDPKAPEMFLLVQKAKEILLDDEKRKAIDEAKRAVAKREEYDQQRSKNMDVRRKRMREELEEKLGAQPPRPNSGSNGSSSSGSGSSSSSSSSSSSNSSSGAGIDLDRLRKEGASLREATAREAEMREEQRLHELAEKKKAAEHEQWLKAAANQIKVKWKRSRQSHSDETLYQLFKEHGAVESVVLVGDKGNAALVTFAEYASARRAVEAYAGSTEYRVTLPADEAQETKKRAAVFTHTYASADSASAPEAAAAGSLGGGAGESDLMRQMRRAVEREQLLRALHEEVGSSGRSDRGAMPAAAPGPSSLHPHAALGGAAPPPPAASTATLAAKEADVLQRMMEAARLKKLKAQQAQAAE